MGDGPEKQNLRELNTTLGVQSKVYFLRPISESRKKCVYKLADVFVYVPVIEVIPEEWPIAPLEALSMGVPTIVSTAVGSIPDIANSVTIVRSGDTEDLYKAPSKVIDDECSREDLRRKSINTYKNVSNELNVYREFYVLPYVSLRRRIG